MHTPITLQLLLDCQMHGRDTLIERGYTQTIAEDCDNRVAEILNPNSHPYQWFWELAELLQSVEDSDLRAMVRQSHAAGYPPVRSQLIVSYQIAGALLRGHLASVEG